MPKYRVMTIVTNTYSTVVDADCKDDAYDIADEDAGSCEGWNWDDGIYECHVLEEVKETT